MPEFVTDPDTKKMIEINNFEVEIEYVANLKEFYKRMHFWLEDEDWYDPQGKQEFETRYWQRNWPDGRVEHWIWWRAFRDVKTEFTKNDFFKYYIRLNFQTVNTTPSEIMHQGKKWKLNQTNTIMRVKTYLKIDQQEGWDKGIMSGFKAKFFEWIYKEKIDIEKDNALMWSNEFQNRIKEFLDLKINEPFAPNIYPPHLLPR